MKDKNLPKLLSALTIRDFLPEHDLAFITKSWIESYYDDNPITKDEIWRIYEYNQRRRMEAILKKAKVLVCCPSDSLTDPISYIVYDFWDSQLVVHWIYAKYIFRKQGIGRSLLNATGHVVDKDHPIFASHCNGIIRKFSVQRKYNVYYNSSLKEPLP